MTSKIVPHLFSPVHPVQPLAGYIGGKRNLASRLCAAIDQIPHNSYAEPFVGMGGVFLRRSAQPKAEFINDWSADVSNFFRILQRHYVAFMDMLRFSITTREGFARLIKIDPDALTDLERAARFLYLQRLSFGGKVRRRNFGVDPMKPARFDITKLAPMLEAVHERLAAVVIERLEWRQFIERYDRPGTLFYLDPPYYGCEQDYGKDMFDKGQFETMAETLAVLQGQFLLSLNDCKPVRQIFARFPMVAVKTSYSVMGGSTDRSVGELVIGSSARILKHLDNT
jgi:DNA adenine methylase